MKKSELEMVRHLVNQVKALNRQVDVFEGHVYIHVMDPLDKMPRPFKVKITAKEQEALGL